MYAGAEKPTCYKCNKQVSVVVQCVSADNQGYYRASALCKTCLARL